MAVKKKASTRKKASAKAAASAKRIKTINAPMTKTQVMDVISGDTGLSKKEVSAVLESLGDVIHGHVKKGAASKNRMLPILPCGPSNGFSTSQATTISAQERRG